VPWFYAIAERDHDIQNPTSAEKIRLMGESIRLGPETRVLDIACGKCGPALVLASTFGCRITGVEQSSEFVAAARERVSEAGLDELIEVVESDGREFPLERESWDVALCDGVEPGHLRSLADAGARRAIRRPGGFPRSRG